MVGNKTIPLLIVGMLLTGISNSMFTKWQDMQCVENCDSPDPADHVEFSQPVWQTAQMFLGECLCLLPGFYSFIMKHIRAFRNRRQGKTANGGYAPVSQNANGDGADGNQQGESNGNGTAGSRDVEGGGGATEDEGEALEGTAPLLFFAPAACDICGTTLMNVGLLFTPVSIYQMTRGALVLWVGVFSVIFLRRHLYLFQWLSLVTVMLGVCIVGLSGTILKEAAPAAASYFFNNSNLPSSFVPAAHPAAAVYNLPLSSEVSPFVNGGLTDIFGEHKKNSTGGGHGGKGGGAGDEPIPEAIEALFGVFLILFAQLFTASQFVLEEKIMSKYDVDPLMAVGYEGLFGVVTTLVAMPTLHFFYGSTLAGQGGYFDMRTGWNQMVSSQPVLWSAAASAVSIALFNGCGLAVTRAISATARSTIDTCRTLGIWVASLLLGWEVLRPLSGSLQMLGFALLVYGTLVFNGIIRPPKFVRPNLRSRSGRSGSRARSRGRSRSGAPGSSSRGDGGGGGGGGEETSGNGEERRSRGRSRRSGGKSKSKSASKSKGTPQQEGEGPGEQAAGAAGGEVRQQAEGSNVKTGKLIDDSAEGGGSKGSQGGQQ